MSSIAGRAGSPRLLSMRPGRLRYDIRRIGRTISRATARPEYSRERQARKFLYRRDLWLEGLRLVSADLRGSGGPMERRSVR
jgi:hypothetical protein